MWEWWATACCDDVQRRQDCTNMPPLVCGTRFRFMLRSFGASVESAPNTGFPYFTPGGFDNSRVFTEGPQAFLALPNPFVITRKGKWMGKTQFFIDALDRASNLGETEAIINRFPIDLELNPGSSFTERTTYTGIYNISGLGFDMSFRVQCSENLYGLNCTTFCEPVEGVYTCNSEGRIVCVQDNRDPTTSCITCVHQGWDLSTGCTTCLPERSLSTNCLTCYNGPELDPLTNCTSCIGREDLDPLTNCTTCVLHGYDPDSHCTECIPNFFNCSDTTENNIPIKKHADTGFNQALVGGVVGGGMAAVIVAVITTLSIAVLILNKSRKASAAPTNVNVYDSFTYTEKTPGDCNSPKHNFQNPLYGSVVAEKPSTPAQCHDQYALEQVLDVPNPFYKEFRDPTSVANSDQGSCSPLY